MSNDQSKTPDSAASGSSAGPDDEVSVEEIDEGVVQAAQVAAAFAERTEGTHPEVAKAWRETEKARLEMGKARVEMDRARSAMKAAQAESQALKVALDKTYVVPPPAPRARLRLRHVMLALGFLLVVAAPAAVTGWYLWERAEDQFASRMGFTVRREEAPSAVDILGGLSNLSSAGSSDSDVLYEFIQSQELVEAVDARLDLRAHYGAPFEADPVFALDPGASVEDLVAYWQRMVQIAYAPSTGLIEVKVLAFEPQAAQAVGEAVIEESSAMINRLSAIARADAIRYAQEDLDASVEQLKVAREAVREFRTRNQIVDPEADIQIQMGLLTTLQQRLGEELIALDLLRETAQSGDPRITQAEQRIEAVRARISEEREKFGAGGQGPGGEDYASVVAEFERLSVDREFAEQKYANALANFDAAQAEAERQSRYLASYLNPTLAETAEYPRRWLILGLTVMFLFIGWAVLTLIYYSLRDRR